MELIKNKEIITSKIRFSDASWYKVGPQKIMLGGAGTISSWVALCLSRIGHEVHVFDFDSVEEVNQSGQMYGNQNIGKKKVEALKENINLFSDTPINIYPIKVTEKTFCTPIALSGFDNMEARKVMFENWKKNENREILIEGRLTAEVGQIYVVKKGMEEEYEKYLFNDSEVEELPCSFKSTTHCGLMISSLMTGVLNNYLSNKFTGVDIREVPFKIEFDLVTLNIENTYVS